MANTHVSSRSPSSSQRRVRRFELHLGLLLVLYASKAFVMPSRLGPRVKSRMKLYVEGEDMTETTDGVAEMRKKFDEFKVGDEVDAVILRKKSIGIWCGISAEKTVRLDEPWKLARRLRIREQVKARIKTVDLEKRQATIGIPDLEELVQDRKVTKAKKKPLPPVKVPSQTESVVDGMSITRGPNSVEISGLDVASVDVDYDKRIVQISLKTLAMADSGAASTKVKPQAVESSGATPTKERPIDPELVEALNGMQVGQVLSGKVVNKNWMGVWADIGSAVKPKLRFSNESFGRKLRFGEEVELKVVSVDAAKGRCSAEVEDVEALVAGRPEQKDVSTLEVGSVHVGHIAQIRRGQLWVDIDCINVGRLNSSDRSYQMGQELKVRVVSVDPEKGKFDLELATD